MNILALAAVMVLRINITNTAHPQGKGFRKGWTFHLGRPGIELLA